MKAIEVEINAKGGRGRKIGNLALDWVGSKEGIMTITLVNPPLDMNKRQCTLL